MKNKDQVSKKNINLKKVTCENCICEYDLKGYTF